MSTVPTDPQGRPAWLAGSEDAEVMQFTLEVVGLRWEKSGRPDADKTFLLREPTPQIERKAQARAGLRPGSGDMGDLIATLLELTVYAIGGKRTNSNHDVIQAWLRDIGPKGRMCLQNAYGSLASVEDDAMERFLATGKIPTGSAA